MNNLSLTEYFRNLAYHGIHVNYQNETFKVWYIDPAGAQQKCLGGIDISYGFGVCLEYIQKLVREHEEEALKEVREWAENMRGQ